MELTAVVFTPQSSNFSNVGVGALGVSINSNSDSLLFRLCGFDIVGKVPALGCRVNWTKLARRRTFSVVRGQNLCESWPPQQLQINALDISDP